MSAILGLIGSLRAVIRWGEPWEFESDDDPLLERSTADESSFWG